MNKKVKLFYRRWKNSKDGNWTTLFITGFGKFKCSKCQKDQITATQSFNGSFGRECSSLSNCCKAPLIPLAYHPDIGEIEFIRIRTYEEYILLKDKQSRELIDFDPAYVQEWENRLGKNTSKDFEIEIIEPGEKDKEEGITLKEIYGD